MLQVTHNVCFLSVTQLSLSLTTTCFLDVTVDHTPVANIPRTILRVTIAPVGIAVASHPAVTNLAAARRLALEYQFHLHVEPPCIVPNTSIGHETDLDQVRRKDDLPSVLENRRNALDLPTQRRVNMKPRSITLPSLIMFALHPIAFPLRNSFS